MRTLDEKLKYNKQKKGNDFSDGYCLGVSLYRLYRKCDKVGKAKIKEMISGFSDTARQGYKYDKGFMCGVRDAANDRKAGRKKIPP